MGKTHSWTRSALPLCSHEQELHHSLDKEISLYTGHGDERRSCTLCLPSGYLRAPMLLSLCLWMQLTLLRMPRYMVIVVSEQNQVHRLMQSVERLQSTNAHMSPRAVIGD